MSTPESRREYIRKLGRQSAVMRALNAYYGAEVIKNRQTIDNWIDWGFAHEHREALMAYGETKSVDPHPDLVEGEKKEEDKQPVPLRAFIHALAKKVGGFDVLSRTTDIRESSLRKMCEKKSGVMPIHVPKLEEIAALYKIPLPDFWDEARLKHKEMVKRHAIAMARSTKRLTAPGTDAT